MNPIARLIDKFTGRDKADATSQAVARQVKLHEEAIREASNAVAELHRLSKVARGTR